MSGILDELYNELNKKKQLSKGLLNLLTTGEECYKINKDGNIECINSLNDIDFNKAKIEQKYFSPEDIINKFGDYE